MDRYQWSFQIAADGSLVNGEPFQRLEMPEEGLFSGVGGLTVDSLGYMWATSAMGIQVCEQPGRCTNILNKPEFTATPITSIAFGGPDRAWLYVTQGGKISAGKPDAQVSSRGNRSNRRNPVCEPRAMFARRSFSRGFPRSRRRRLDRLAAARRRARRPSPTASTPTRRRAAARRSTTARAADVIARISAAANGPALKEERFARDFAGKDLKTLFTKIATTMPRGAPASLGENVYLDIVAHLLKENGFPAGSQRAHRRCARGHPRRAGKTQAAAADRRFLLRGSGGLPHRRARRTRGC